MTRDDWDHKGLPGITRDDGDDYGRVATAGMSRDD